MIGNAGEISRYIINGLAATLIHFSVLVLNLDFLHFSSAGLANLIASCFGIIASFFGNRYFVFRKSHEKLWPQAVKFVGLYAAIALLHGGVLWIWTDKLQLDYRAGFVLATGLQVSLSYFGNKYVAFKA